MSAVNRYARRLANASVALVALGAALVALGAEHAAATPELGLGPPQLITPADRFSYGPYAAQGASGSTTVAWLQLSEDRSSTTRMARRIDPGGQLGPPIVLDDFVPSAFEIASDSRGRSLLAGFGSDPETDEEGLGVSWISADGVAEPTRILLDPSEGTPDNLSPVVRDLRVLIDSDDVATLVWAESRFRKPRDLRRVSTVRAIRLQPSGEASDVITLASHGGQARELSAALDSEDRVRVLWRRLRNGKDGLPLRRQGQVRLATLTPDGQISEQVLFKDRGSRTIPFEALSGSHVAVVRNNRRGNKQVLLAAPLRADGSIERARVVDRSRSSMRPRLVDSGGQALVAWHGRSRIKAAVIDARSGRPGKARAISGRFDGPGGGVRGATPAIDSGGRGVIAWRLGTVGVEAVRLDREGRPGPVQRLQDGSSLVRGVRVFIDADGQATIVWQGSTGVLPDPTQPQAPGIWLAQGR